MSKQEQRTPERKPDASRKGSERRSPVGGNLLWYMVAVGVGMMLLPELKVAKLGEVAEAGSILEAAEGGVQTLDANLIRFSQSNVRSSLPDIVASMKANGWQGAPIDVVRMADGGLTAIDNTRLLAAHLTDTPVQAVIRDFNEVFPAARAGGNLQGATWGEAVMNRIGDQRPGWLRLYPSGSPFTGVHPSTPGFSP